MSLLLQINDFGHITKAFAEVKNFSMGRETCATLYLTASPPEIASRQGAQHQATAEECWEMTWRCFALQSPLHSQLLLVGAAPPELSNAKHFSDVYTVKNCPGRAKSNCFHKVNIWELGNSWGQ